MYRAHSKDINRNKSFHPLTAKNLGKTERLQEAEAERQKRVDERAGELRREQEERRYDELLLASSADGASGDLARHKQLQSVFAAEYAADKEEQKQKENTVAPMSSKLSFAGAMAKFKKDPAEVKTESPVDGEPRRASGGASGEASSHKRPRTEAPDAPKTGFVTSAEAAHLRKELNQLQKQRLDPLRRVEQHNNRVVAEAARRQAIAESHQEQSSSSFTPEQTGKYARMMADLDKKFKR